MQLSSQKDQQTCGHRESGSCQGRLSRGCPSSRAVWPLSQESWGKNCLWNWRRMEDTDNDFQLSFMNDAFLVIVAILFFVFCVYAFFYLNLSTEMNLDVDED
ncbi:triple QxxK/R motif-containing protein isoform X2 [Anarhichas minor]|uniref:triple QxxK/R motif-containing protein isoform X2 n=1 Tax=Anarhichas minor TaxID=65739 RepID=UPI003F73BFF3